MADFTRRTYLELLQTLLELKYPFQTFREFLETPSARSIILRHDVDRRPGNSLILARMEREQGIRGVYYFRAVAESWDEKIIKEISDMDHEIGYHYENLAMFKGNMEQAFEDFKANLSRMRSIVPVTTIAMHGSPRSKHDSKDLWKKYDYKSLDILGEPYLDMDFSRVLYLTDTGRRWDGFNVSIRDRVNPAMNQKLSKNGYPIRSTFDLIRAARNRALPDQVMFNIHPQRWHSNSLLWFGEFILQNVKNVVKGSLVRSRDSR